MAQAILFRDRVDAGRQLASRLKSLSFRDPIVIALPRGGVPVAKEIAEVLHAPLDVLIVRKIGVPRHHELGAGAISEDRVILMNEKLMLRLGLTQSMLKESVRKETIELNRRVEQFRQGRPFRSVKEREVILVDDGLATGYTAAVAVKYLKSHGARKVTLAVPVCAEESADFLAQYVDDVICIRKPEPFFGVGMWYEDFEQTTDEEVKALLENEQRSPKTPSKETFSHSNSYMNELEKKARPFHSIADFEPLIEKIKNKKIVMIGEATHGTHEFYEWRAAISKELIEKQGFNFVAVEGDWPPCDELNQFVHQRRGEDIRQTLSSFDRWPTWMWANKEIAGFAEWMRNRNSNVGFHGLDVYSLFDSMARVVKQLEKIDPLMARRAQVHYSCFDPYVHNEIGYARSLYTFPEGCKEQVVQVLNEVVKKRVKKLKQADEILFDALQNARIVFNAENYYRTMIEANEDSWNVRDQHMMDTLDALLEHYGSDSKAIVWEHNTHVGDYRATDMLSHGQVNVGGLAREKYGESNVALIGFGTYQGTVIASHAWDGPVQTLVIPEAHSGSVESECHALVSRLNQSQFFFLFDSSSRTGALGEVKGHRAIGVVYDPRRERFGNYVPTVLPQRYDGFIFIDETRALAPIQSKFDHEKIPETWPLGR